VLPVKLATFVQAWLWPAGVCLQEEPPGLDPLSRGLLVRQTNVIKCIPLESAATDLCIPAALKIVHSWLAACFVIGSRAAGALGYSGGGRWRWEWRLFHASRSRCASSPSCGGVQRQQQVGMW